MTDDVLGEIERLEKELAGMRHSQAAGTPGVGPQIEQAQQRLDQLWDLRRRQDAARSAGAIPPEGVRDAATVERYRQ